jgi:hypothetical protein
MGKVRKYVPPIPKHNYGLIYASTVAFICCSALLSGTTLLVNEHLESKAANGTDLSSEGMKTSIETCHLDFYLQCLTLLTCHTVISQSSTSKTSSRLNSAEKVCQTASRGISSLRFSQQQTSTILSTSRSTQSTSNSTKLSLLTAAITKFPESKEATMKST